MRSYFLILFLTTYVISFTYPQADTIPPPDMVINPQKDSLDIYLGTITREVSFPGGYSNYISREIKNYLSKNELKKIPNNTRILISIVITKEGNVKNFMVLRPPANCDSLIKALKHLFLNMKGWSPAYNEGEPVNRKIILPLIFNTDK